MTTFQSEGASVIGGGGGGGRSRALQRGQRGCDASHRSAQLRWKAWRQPGRTRAACPASMSSRQTAHSAPPSPTDAPSPAPPSRPSSASVNPFSPGAAAAASAAAAPAAAAAVGERIAAYHRRHRYSANTRLIPAHTRNSPRKRIHSILFFFYFGLSSFYSSLYSTLYIYGIVVVV